MESFLLHVLIAVELQISHIDTTNLFCATLVSFLFCFIISVSTKSLFSPYAFCTRGEKPCETNTVYVYMHVKVTEKGRHKILISCFHTGVVEDLLWDKILPH
jgi:hypothetical protein